MDYIAIPNQMNSFITFLLWPQLIYFIQTEIHLWLQSIRMEDTKQWEVK